jgi:hypothetical protein
MRVLARGLVVGLAVLIVASSVVSSASLMMRPAPAPEKVSDRVKVAGRELALETDLWRDFMPISPPDGQPLLAILKIQTIDRSRLPRGIRADQVSITYEGDVWTAQVKARGPRVDPNVLEVVARDGPKWGPDVKVDVVVRLRDVWDRVYWLCATDQLVGRTD